ncbi:hypothetical protein FA15DRAFT_736446 [Coprinopsis marcescibilis]|uniref:GH16 domain-containing protein n=1 Tax=Coprinopsis marcescibilis TaxID=230819 RepID=A0A5C3LAP7_COPMA|nr:hypothetical protein FA15DRAFT_736446 [Coprinopsis marcescibilis]
MTPNDLLRQESTSPWTFFKWTWALLLLAVEVQAYDNASITDVDLRFGRRAYNPEIARRQNARNCIPKPGDASHQPQRRGLFDLFGLDGRSEAGELEVVKKRDEVDGYYDANANGTKFLWSLEDVHAGESFFDEMAFFSYRDPTEGHVNYVNESEARRKRLIYTEPDGTVIMRADQETHLPHGAYRDSVRIETKKNYTGGLFVLDMKKAPWGCAVWPAFWSTNARWPCDGEIDILEGVHDAQHNQVTWHTAPGCHLDASAEFTGDPVVSSIENHPPVNGTIDCDSDVNGNAGCGIYEWSRSSYGPFFEEQGGGIIAMKWDENGIAVWSFFRNAIPKDLANETPETDTWGPPSAVLMPSRCDLGWYFKEHVIIFDITFCGVWAGVTYTDTQCPGTCETRMMDPANFVNATWAINYLKIYRKVPVFASIISGNSGTKSSTATMAWGASLLSLALGFITIM